MLFIGVYQLSLDRWIELEIDQLEEYDWAKRWKMVLDEPNIEKS